MNRENVLYYNHAKTSGKSGFGDGAGNTLRRVDAFNAHGDNEEPGIRQRQTAEIAGIRKRGESAMSKTSFKAFCIEFYANHTGKTGPEIYKEFERSGLLKELEDDYEDLHGMGMEALMQLFDRYLGREVAK